MIIKLTSRDDNTLPAKKPSVGDKFYKYFFTEVYDKGEVIEADDQYITVDFGDTIKRFNTVVCSFVFSTQLLDHLMTCDDGELIRDFRSRSQKNEKEYEDFEFDFSKWMV